MLKSSEKVSSVETRQCYQHDESIYEIPSQTTNDQHNFDNESATYLPSKNRNSNSNSDINKRDNVLAKESKIKKLKNIPTIEFIEDSHLNTINPKGLSNKNNVIVRNHPGCTTEDLMSYIVPKIKKKRDAIDIHCGENDLTNDKNTIQNLQSIVNKIRRLLK